MSTVEDPFGPLVVEVLEDDFEALTRRAAGMRLPPAAAVPGAATARLEGFDLEDQPVLAGVPGLAGELVPARTSVQLLREQIGSTVVVLFEGGDVRRPIVVGVLQGRPSPSATGVAPAPLVSARIDDQRVVLTAEREIVLRCGQASITLTRAGKVLIEGAYVLSRSTGYNKIKGAAVDIN
jgi:hypothetical protein